MGTASIAGKKAGKAAERAPSSLPRHSTHPSRSAVSKARTGGSLSAGGAPMSR